MAFHWLQEMLWSPALPLLPSEAGPPALRLYTDGLSEGELPVRARSRGHLTWAVRPAPRSGPETLKLQGPYAQASLGWPGSSTAPGAAFPLHP